MLPFEFKLNNEPLSKLVGGAMRFAAFSGLGNYINQRSAACIVNQGPIPPGEYYIFDRESRGRLGWFRDMFRGRRDWFALYADDGRIDDETWCEQVKRGQFRLHPEGPLGISQGCIVLKRQADFQVLRSVLRGQDGHPIQGIDLLAWGKVTVR